MKRLHVDANVILRFLRNDDAKQSPRARSLVDSAQRGETILILSSTTLAEIFYALRASYRMSRTDAADLLIRLLHTGVFELEDENRMLDALARVARANVDFGDAHLAALAVSTGEPIVTFDQDFKKFSDVVIHVP
ncbi:MAG: PIN domain-containing protein [Opitutaceae bacterium]|nr:PIN domain-containing protein [Opitutaceae bacterium]